MKHKLFHLAAVSLLLAATGCTSVVKQNVISSINTGIGISLTENPQTQLYEAKLGYIRSQFYSVPTGKTLCTDCPHADKNCPAKNDADKAVTILAGIRVNSGIQHLFLGADIVESFAIGADAVNSPAAVAMYVSQAKTEKLGQEAATATRFTVEAKEQADKLRTQVPNAIDWIYGKGTGPDTLPDGTKLAAFLKGSNYESKIDQIKTFTRAQLTKKLNNEWLLDFSRTVNNVPVQP